MFFIASPSIVYEPLYHSLQIFSMYFNIIYLHYIWCPQFSGNPCYPNPCNNGGSCLVFYTVYLCKCPKAYRGTRCNGKSWILGPILSIDIALCNQPLSKLWIALSVAWIALENQYLLCHWRIGVLQLQGCLCSMLNVFRNSILALSTPDFRSPSLPCDPWTLTMISWYTKNNNNNNKQNKTRNKPKILPCTLK